MPKRVVVGIFEIERDTTCSEPKWVFRNTITGIVHKTYGTWREIEALALQQSKAWKIRIKENGPGLMRKQPRTGAARVAAARKRAAKAVERESDG